MERLGFKPEGDASTKAGFFVKNLIKQAYGFDIEIPAKYKEDEPMKAQEVSRIILEELEGNQKKERDLSLENNSVLIFQPKLSGKATKVFFEISFKNSYVLLKTFRCASDEIRHIEHGVVRAEGNPS